MTKTIHGLINTSEYVKITTWVKFEPNKNMYACMNNGMYDFPKDELNSEILFEYYIMYLLDKLNICLRNLCVYKTNISEN